MAVEMDFARGSDEAFLSDDLEMQAAFFGEALEAVAEIYFFAGEEFVAETGNLTE